jgi:hypothetical protein
VLALPALLALLVQLVLKEYKV